MMAWEMDYYPIEETQERSWLDWILHMGVAIGKKMLVAGIVVSSAPVVLPPLVVVSALGFAVSVPFGMIVASYACSKKLLNKLLPGTSPHSLEGDDYASAYKEVEEDYEFREALSLEEVQDKKSDEVKDDLNTRTGLSILGKEPREEVIVKPAATSLEGVVLIVETFKHEHQDSETVEASIEITDVINAKDSVATNNKKLDHGVIGKLEAANEVNSNGKKIKKKGRKKEKADAKKLPESSDVTAEIKSGAVQFVAAGTDAREDQPILAKDDDMIIASKNVAIYSLPGETAPEVETNSARKVIFPSPDKGMDTEDGIWQKINAMRRIVGYKATRQASCMEELRALYLFTGVEPPVSFKDTSDLVEVNEKLRFLFSVVGVE